MNDVFWRRLFVVAGIFNLLVGLPMALDVGLFGALSGLPIPADTYLYVRMTGILIAAFGVGYLIVSSDLDKNRALIVLGAFGKGSVVVLFVLYWMNGTLGFGNLTAAFVDLIFAALFVRFLTRYPAR